MQKVFCAAIPCPFKLSKEALNLIHLRDGNSHQRETNGCEHAVHFYVALLSVCRFMTRVIQFDTHHRHSIFNSTNEKIDMLLADFIKPGTVIVLHEICQTRLAGDDAPSLR